MLARKYVLSVNIDSNVENYSVPFLIIFIVCTTFYETIQNSVANIHHLGQLKEG